MVRLLGVRHHGPGSARAVLAALEELPPDLLLVEIPADAEAALGWIGHPDLEPPVALLAHVVDRPRRAVFSPFARFSPEWQAIAWANAREVPVQAIDLPHSLTLAAAGSPGDAGSSGDAGSLGEVGPGGGGHGDEPRDGTTDGPARLFDGPAPGPTDPIAELAAAAGDPDPERWWDDVVEHRGGGLDAFDAVAEAMAAVRRGVEPAAVERRREAHMRRSIRRAIKDLSSGSAERQGVVAVVCGAWHVPALDPAVSSVSADAGTLRGLPKVKVAVSWVPWTHRRLASPGYGAAVRSPGWYAHVFRHPGPDGVARFVVDAAHELRSVGLAASPDHLVATTRLADALAVLRGRPRPGLDEVLDAADSVMGGLAVVEDRLVIGHAIGSVPESAPQVPLVRDLAAQQRRLRMRPTDEPRQLELDLRTPNGLARSRLLHRLDALGLGWGVLEEGRGSTGTFRETWRLRWEPELSVRAVELAGYGTTIESAAVARLAERAQGTLALGALASLVDAALLADLPDAVETLVQQLERRAAADPDIGGLMDALGPLSRSRRYGDVRSTDVGALDRVIDGLVVRILAGLPGACRSLDDEAAAVMTERIGRVQAALALLGHPARGAGRSGLLAVLDRLADAPVHGLVRGRCTRLLHDAGEPAARLGGPGGEGVHDAGGHDAGGGGGLGGAVRRRLGRALSPGTPAADGARFVEGFLAGSGTVLLHDEQLRSLLDDWLGTLTPESFLDVVPLLRRTFGAFEAAERRQLGRLLAGRPTDRRPVMGEGLDPERVARTLATVRLLVGLVVGRHHDERVGPHLRRSRSGLGDRAAASVADGARGWPCRRNRDDARR